MRVIITGYYNKKNYGDDLFNQIANSIFSSPKFKQNITSFSIIPTDKLLAKETFTSCDKIILFGGEVLNDYFLNILIQYIEKVSVINKIEAYAVGVSSNQSYETIINKLYIFNSIVFRSLKDYQYFKPYISCAYCPDIVFSLKQKKEPFFSTICSANKKLITRKSIGFFLSQTALNGMTLSEEETYINKITEYIKICINMDFFVYLFPMCTNEIKKSECDLFINKRLDERLLNKIMVITDTDNILKLLPQLEFSVCWRYHAHILSIISNVPFISISETPKVKALLKDNNLENCFLTDNSPMGFKRQLEYYTLHKGGLKHNLKKIYKGCKLAAKNTYMSINTYTYTSTLPYFYLSNIDRETIFQHIVSLQKKYQLVEADSISALILFTLQRNLHTEYKYGLEQKVKSLLHNANGKIIDFKPLKNDIIWLIDDCILKKNAMFYTAMNDLLKRKPVEQNDLHKYNFKYMDQDNCKGVHRSGWSYVLNECYKYNNPNETATLCDLYLDRTFHWDCEILKKIGVIPYKKEWVGFIHHTCEMTYSDYNTVALFKNPVFIESLACCKALYVLSTDLKDTIHFTGLCPENIPIIKLTHPTEFTDINFSFQKFLENKNRKIVQIGAWLRNLNAINLLKLDQNAVRLSKYVLKGKKMDSYYVDKLSTKDKDQDQDQDEEDQKQIICRDYNTKSIILDEDVQVIEYLNDTDYDELLSENIVFINLINASAVNTIIECIARNTPIIVNRLPATIELLGDKYPLFSDVDNASNLLTMDNIQAAYKYLKEVDKTQFKLKTFVETFLLK